MTSTITPYILILFDSRSGHTEKMAYQIARGAENNQSLDTKIRKVSPITDQTDQRAPKIPVEGATYANLDDLANCSGLIMGSPTHFGQMSAALQFFWSQTTPLWMTGKLIGKPASVFTSTGSMHGGQETTLFHMMVPLLHHGMLMSGIPYSQSELMNTTVGGTPYGASHLAGAQGQNLLHETEKNVCIAQGKRMAQLTLQLLK